MIATKIARRFSPKVMTLAALGCVASLLAVAHAAEAVAKPRTLVTISKETTYITAPLRADGYPDYLAALNQKASEGATSESNAVVLLMRAFGPDVIDGKSHAQFFTMLGLVPPPDHGDYFVDFEAYLKKHNPEALKDRRDAKGWWCPPLSYSEEHRACRLWRKEDCPLMAAWLAANEKPLARVVEASRRPRFYIPAIAAGTWELKGSVHAVSSSIYEVLKYGLIKRAKLRIGEGDVEGAWPDILACRRLGRQLDWPISGSSFGVTIEQISYGACWQLAYSSRITPELAKKYWADINELPPRRSGLRKIADDGRCEYLDRICAALRNPEKAANILGEQRVAILFLGLQDIKTLPKVGVSQFDVPNYALAKLVASGLIDWDRVLRLGNEHYDKIAAVDRLPTVAKKSDALDALQRDIMRQIKKHGGDTPAKSPSLPDEPDLSKEERKAEATRQFSADCLADCLSYGGGGHGLPWVKLREDTETTISLELTHIAFALGAYHTEYNCFPKTLDVLMPKYLDRVPNDPYGSGPYRYRRLDEGYLLYSLGLNGVDDSGPRPASVRVPPDPPEWMKSDDYGLRMPDHSVEQDE